VGDNTHCLIHEEGTLLTELYWKNAVFCEVTPRDSCKNRSFGGTHRLHHQCDKNR
jgi:hypothetical protein